MKEVFNMIKDELYKYIEENILPQYTDNIGGHGIDHITSVIERSFEIASSFKLEVDPNMVYTIAVFHDIGYKVDPDNHEQVSSEMFLQDDNMQAFFTDEERQIIAEAIVDHRASLEYEARSIYGKLVSSADRAISVNNMLERSLKYQKDKHASENPTLDQVIAYSYKKLSSKYGKGGYAKMYYPDKKYQEYLTDMQTILENFDLFAQREKKIAKEISLFPLTKVKK